METDTVHGATILPTKYPCRIIVLRPYTEGGGEKKHQLCRHSLSLLRPCTGISSPPVTGGTCGKRLSLQDKTCLKSAAPYITPSRAVTDFHSPVHFISRTFKIMCIFAISFKRKRQDNGS